MKTFFYRVILILLFSGSILSQGQTLTISTGGQTGTSGTNWSITGNTLTVTGTANIRASVITNALASGSLQVIGNTSNFAINVNEAITTSTGGHTLTLGSSINNGAINIASNISINGAIFVYGSNIGLTASIASTLSNSGNITLAATGYIATNTNGLNFTTSGGAILFTADTDGSNSGSIILDRASLSSNGGNITLGGGNLSGTGHAVGLDYTLPNGATPNFRGIWVHSSSINAGGGNITLRGKGATSSTSLSYYWIGVDIVSFGSLSGTGNQIQTTGSGTININGLGGDNGNAGTHGAGINFYSDAGTQNITTASGTIELNGTAGIGTAFKFTGVNHDGGNLNVVSSSGNVMITGIAGTGTTEFGVSFAGNVNIGGNGTTNTTGNITITSDRFNAGGTYNFRNTGNITIHPHNNSFNQSFNWDSRFALTGSKSGLSLGKTTNTANIDINAALSVVGPVEILGGNVTVNANIASSSNGDILIKGIGNSNPCISINSGITINKSAGTGTLTLQGHARIINSGTISATGSGMLNVVMWSDFDNSNNDGGVNQDGTISTNGGHVWLGGSNSNGGSYTWKGLTVGDGPSIGSSGYNSNALSLAGSITTSNGHVFVWAGTGPGMNGIAAGTTGTINAGTGNITLKSNFTAGTFNLTTTGTVSLVPNAGSYESAITLAGSVSSGSLIFNTSPYNGLRINNINSVGGLTIGRNEEHLSSGSPVVFSNSSSLTITATGMNVAGPISVYGGTVVINANLTSSLASAPILLQSTGAINIASSRTVQSNGGHITLRSNAGGTALSNASSIILNSGSSLLSQGGNITLGGNFTGAKGSGLYATSGNAPAILLNGGTISAAGGTIKLYGKCNASYDDGIRLLGTINTTGAGTIELYGEAHGGYNSTDYFGGITFGSSAGSTIETENGNIVLNGILTNTQSSSTGAINFYRNNGSSGQTNHINLLSKTGNININADIGSTGAYGIGHSSWGNVYIGSPASGWTATGNIVLSYARLVNAGLNGFKVKTTGAVTYEPTASSFTAAQTFPPNSNYIVAENASSLTIGKSGNTANVIMAASTSVAGPILVYGGNIAVNENLNTSAGTTSGHVLLKGSADVILAASKSITTSGAPVILWANSDNEATNGSIALRNGSSIVTGSGSVAGGHVWIGGGSNGTTWNGLAVGNGYAVPGTSFTPSNGGGALQAGIYLERNSISSFGGNIKIAGDGAATARGIVTYGNTIAINAGSGKIDIDGQVTSSAAGNRGGVLFGLHDVSIASTMDISSSSTSGDAITINGVGRGTEDAIALSGTLNITSSGGGNIVLNGNALGSGRSIVAGNYYHGILNIFANSGNISLNGNTKAVQVATAITNGSTSGPSKLNIGQGGIISSSSSDITITGDQIAIAAGGIAANSIGKLVVEPFNTSFNASVSWPMTNFSVASGLTGLRLGKDGNTADITIASAQTIAGPIEVYGGNIAVNENLNTSAGNTSGDIILKGSADIIIATTKSITTNGGDVVLWANSDGQTTNGGVFFDAQTSLTTNGGHLWIGGSSTSNGSITWNGLTVGNGYAVSGRNLVGLSTRTSFKVDWDAGILLNETSINTGGGNIYLGGQRNSLSNHSGGAGIINYNGTNGTTINAGSGTIDIKAFGSHTADVTIGFLTGLHPGETSGNLTIQSSNSNQATAISIEANNASTNFPGLVVEDETNIISSSSTNGGGISIIGITGGNNYGVMVQVGSLNTLSASGKITLDGGTKGIGLHVNSSFTNSSSQSISNTGYLYMGSRTGYAITSSNANIDIISDILNNNTGTSVNIASSGQLNILSKSNAFSQTLSTSQWNLSSNLSGLTIGKTTNTADITFGGTTTIAGPVTAYGGTLTLNENLSSSNGSNISLFGNGLTIASGKTVASSGQLIIAPQAVSTTIGLAGASGTLSLPASYFSTNFTDGFSNIQIGSNAQTGNISTNAFTLRDNMTFLTTGSLSLGGKPILGSNNVTLGSGISSISGTPTHYFQTTGSGTVNRTLANSASLLFPIGNAVYNPITIANNTGSSDDFSAKVRDAVLEDGTTGIPMRAPHVGVTWDINTNITNVSPGIDITVQWESSQERNSINSYRLNHYNSSTAAWEFASGTSATPSGSTTKTMTHSGYIGTFSPFAIGQDVTPLPVTLLTFEAEKRGENALLTWTTANETNNSHFEVLKSLEGQTWEKIGEVTGSGTSYEQNSYTFTDTRFQGLAYYKLRQVDYDGNFSYSPIRMLHSSIGYVTSPSVVYPNPSQGSLSLQAPENSRYELYDVLGKQIREGKVSVGMENIENLSTGVYTLKVVAANNIEYIKVVIE